MTEAIETEAAPEATETKTSYDGAEIRSARREATLALPVKESKETPEEPVKPVGYDPIDTATASPEQVKDRLDYLYRQVKDNRRTNNEWKQLASEQSRQIEELTKGFNGVVHHLQGKSLDDSEEAITAQLNAAFQAGDNKAYLDAQKKLINLGVEKRLVAERATAAPKAPSVTQKPIEEPAPDLTDAEYRTVEAWQNETDERGNALRPWAKTADMNNPDPQFNLALSEMKAILANPRFAATPYDQKLAELDRRMGVAKRVNSQTVSGVGLTGRAKTSKVSLSPEIERMAIRTRFGGPKAKTDAEHIEAYRQQLLKVRGTRK